MKIKNLLATVLACTMATTSITATNVLADDSLHLKVMGIDITSLAQPQIINGRTMVPVRAIFEAVGATVDWDNDTKTITGTKDGKVVVMQIGSTQISINGNTSNIDTPPVIINGRTLAPARFVAESYGFSVDWDNDTRTVNLKKNEVDETSSETTVSTTETTSESTTETTTETTSESTTESTSETTTELNFEIKDLSQSMVKQIKTDLKTAINNYSLGNTKNLARFTESYRTNTYKNWSNMAQNDFDLKYVAIAKTIYEKVYYLYYDMDSYNIEHPEAKSEDTKLYVYYKDGVKQIYLNFANSETYIDALNAKKDMLSLLNKFIEFAKVKGNRSGGAIALKS